MTNRSVFALVLLTPVLARAAPEPTTRGIDVSVSCERKAAKGRVICDVEIEASSGRIAWADVVVVVAPPFAPPLRARVAVADARSRTDHRVRIPVAFVATAQGRGTVIVRGRATVCVPSGAPAGETCGPTSKDAQTDLVVGTDVEH